MGKAGRRKKNAVGHWTVTTIGEPRHLACAHMALGIARQTSRAAFLDLVTHFRKAEKSMGMLGTFEIGLKRLTLIVSPTNFAAHHDGFLTAHMPARVERAIEATAMERSRGGLKLEVAPELALGVEGLAVKAGALGAQRGGTKTRQAAAVEVERPRAQIRPVGKTIEVQYWEPKADGALEGQFREKVRGAVRSDEEVRFALAATPKQNDYVVIRQRTSMTLAKPRQPILHHVVLYTLRNDPEFVGPYRAEVSCSYGKVI